MRRLLLAFVVATAIGIAIYLYAPRPALRSQLAAYRIGQARSFDEARRELADIERQPKNDTPLRELVSGWRTGNQTFDFYLASYLTDRQSSEDLRRLFSLELSWQPARLHHWAHFWSWRSKLPPAEQIASISEYLSALSTAGDKRALTWREVLDLQAVLALTGHADLAQRLAPDNWADRYRAWKETSPDFAQVVRPERPLPDWQGPVPVMPKGR